MKPDGPDYSDWVGRSESAEDIVTTAAVAAMSATLDRNDPEPRPGDPLPPLWHWMFFTPKVHRSGLGPDGHPERGDFLPPINLPRRMFAGATYQFHTPLRLGETVRRTSEISAISSKQGRSGPLVFVKVRHSFSVGDQNAFEEIQDIVFREAAGTSDTPASPPKPAEIENAAWHQTIVADPATLFRYSALTFNAHRIHYDHPYATEVEGYPGLVVHGPLIANYLVEMCRQQTNDRPLARFSFRALQPLFADIPFDIAGNTTPDDKGFWLKALNPDGGLAMEANGTFA